MLLTTFCFEIGSISAADLAVLVRETGHFQPTRIRCSEFCKNGGPFAPHHLDKLTGLKNVSSLQLETAQGMKGPYLHFATLGAWGFHVVYWQSPDAGNPALEALSRWTQREGFTAGYWSDADYVFWQSVESLNTYELYGRPAADLPKIPDPDFGTEKIDISKNPGRRTAFPGMWLQAAWRMWFGPGSFGFFPPDRLMSFPNPRRRAVLPNGTIFIELFEHASEAEKPENEAAHKRFRECTGMDELEKRAHEFVEGKADPSTEIRRGAFPHGGVWLMTQWFDAGHGLARRSKASYRMSVELNAQFEPLWQSGSEAP